VDGAEFGGVEVGEAEVGEFAGEVEGVDCLEGFGEWGVWVRGVEEKGVDGGEVEFFEGFLDRGVEVGWGETAWFEARGFGVDGEEVGAVGSAYEAFCLLLKAFSLCVFLGRRDRYSHRHVLCQDLLPHEPLRLQRPL
jgi:hypothetical protein